MESDNMQLTEEDIQTWYGEMFTHAFHVGIFVDCDDKEYTIEELKQQILENQRLRELVEERGNPNKFLTRDFDKKEWDITNTLQSLLDKAKQVSNDTGEKE